MYTANYCVLKEMAYDLTLTIARWCTKTKNEQDRYAEGIYT